MLKVDLQFVIVLALVTAVHFSLFEAFVLVSICVQFVFNGIFNVSSPYASEQLVHGFKPNLVQFGGKLALTLGTSK